MSWRKPWEGETGWTLEVEGGKWGDFWQDGPDEQFQAPDHAGRMQEKEQKEEKGDKESGPWSQPTACLTACPTVGGGGEEFRVREATWVSGTGGESVSEKTKTTA